MSVYNDEEYLEEAIESILNQTYKEFEFIIINDGSTDGSMKILNKYANYDNRIVLIHQENIGLTKSLNKGIALSQGKYIARMDSDDISLSTRFENQIEFLEEYPNYALLGTNIIKIDSIGNELEVNKSKYSHEDIIKTFKNRNCFAHGSIMVNKSLVQDDFIYDETFLYSQDYRLWAKIAKKHKVKNLKKPLYKLRLHEGSISRQKIEKQSIYAGIVAYEFEMNSQINDIESELLTNKELRTKVGKILLMNFEFELSRKYLSLLNPFYYLSYLLIFINLSKIKNFFK
jgi:glycosyltransferase involved in cell wall biosynthesis